MLFLGLSAQGKDSNSNRHNRKGKKRQSTALTSLMSLYPWRNSFK